MVGLATRPTWNIVMNFYRRKLPHWQPAGAQYFITYRLAGSLPRKVIQELQLLREQFNSEEKTNNLSEQQKIQRKVFQRYEDALDRGNTGPTWLNSSAVAGVVKEAMHYRDSKEYDLFAYCIMSNHVHLVFEHLMGQPVNLLKEKKFPITAIMQELKRYTAYECNKILNRSGPFWQSESFDRVIRDQDELENTIRYTLNNPVKAGLVQQWEDWPYNYCKPEFRENFM